MTRKMKLLKYAYGLKLNAVVLVFLLIVGLIFEIFGPAEMMTSSASCVYIMLSGIFIVQIWYGLNASALVKSSTVRRDAQTLIPTVLCTAVSFVAVAVMLAIRLVRYANASEEGRVMIANGLLVTSLAIFLLMIYTGVAYKFFVLSLFLFLGCYLGVEVCVRALLSGREEALIPMAAGVAFNLFAVLAGGAVQYGIQRLIYRHEMSKYAMDARLRRSM